MKIDGWILSKCDPHPDSDGIVKPIVASMSLAWHGPMQPLDPNGWMLVQVRCDAGHFEFIKQDEDVIWIGNEWSAVPKELLDAYADKLDPKIQYQFLGQVLDKLSDWDSRFLTRLPALTR